MTKRWSTKLEGEVGGGAVNWRRHSVLSWVEKEEKHEEAAREEQEERGELLASDEWRRLTVRGGAEEMPGRAA